VTTPEESRPPRRRFFDRGTTDILILMVPFTICSSVVVGGTAVLISEIVNPDSDTTRAIVLVSETINTLIGLLAGFLAGRTESTQAALKAQQEETKKP